MVKISDTLRYVETGHMSFWCPACNARHIIRTEGPMAAEWNKDNVKPSFSLPVKTLKGHYSPDFLPGLCWCEYYKDTPDEKQTHSCSVCHLTVQDGMIHYHSDSTHALSGLTVPLPIYP